MDHTAKLSTGIPGLDQCVDMLRWGDNVVWQAQSVDDYSRVVEPFARQAVADKRKLIYIHFGRHPHLLPSATPHRSYTLNAAGGFENFASSAHTIIAENGPNTFYVFDCLTDLLESWHSDLMLGNFFQVSCSFLFKLETIAYFGIIHNAHTYDTIARIRETTQLLLNVHTTGEKLYIHPLKVWERHSPAMFFPHQIEGDEATCITASVETAELLSTRDTGGPPQDHWEATIAEAERALLEEDSAQTARFKNLLIPLILSKEPKIQTLCKEYFSLQDILQIAKREIGTGLIGGKSVGMLLARKILDRDAEKMIRQRWEPHDSYYLGADVFYTYIVHNKLWDLRMRQKKPEGYYACAPELLRKILAGEFPPMIQERFKRMLEHFGQSPIIVRSSSLLEDNYGNAFAGKYESLFCANQGSPEERYNVFEQSLKTVYASIMSQDALAYRMNRGLMERDEQMAVLVQRVSGDRHGEWFFPHVAGMGNSSNLYVWDKTIDPEAGMLRLVLGLGTRAVNRTAGDYARLVALDAPGRPPLMAHGEEKKFSQHRVDLIQVRENRLTDVVTEEVARADLKTDTSLFFSPDEEAARYFQEVGQKNAPPPILDFKRLLTATDFPDLARSILATLAKAYQYPVDIEFTANFSRDGGYVFNLLQCRPLQTKTIGRSVEIPSPKQDDILFSTTGNFLGGNVRLAFDHLIFVRAKEYMALPPRRQYEVARLVGLLNQRLKGKHVLLMGPGRWGTSTPSLGIPVYFSDICNMTAICEYADPESGAAPDLSFGSHFFQDIVESDIFYAAILAESPGVVFRPQLLLGGENLVPALAPELGALAPAIHLAEAAELALYADVPSQQLVCCLQSRHAQQSARPPRSLHVA